MDTLYARLLQLIDRHRAVLEIDDFEAHVDVLERLRFELQLERDTAQAILQESQLTHIPCYECGSRVLNKPVYLRLKLCTMCMCSGLLAQCVHCGENYPEHHPGGRGCLAWERRALTVAEEQEQW